MKDKNEQSAVSLVDDLKQLQQNFSEDEIGRDFVTQATKTMSVEGSVFDINSNSATIVKDLTKYAKDVSAISEVRHSVNKSLKR
jgi:hypothetical protein